MANTTATHSAASPSAAPAVVGPQEKASASMADRLDAVLARLVRTLGPDDLAAISAVITELRAMSPNVPPAVPGHAPAATTGAHAATTTTKHT